MEDNFLWVERFRPRTIQECVLPGELKKYFTNQIEKGEIQNMLLCGSPGTGKLLLLGLFVTSLKVIISLLTGLKNLVSIFLELKSNNLPLQFRLQVIQK